MMLSAPPLRFIAGVLTLWACARAWMLWPEAEALVPAPIRIAISPTLATTPSATPRVWHYPLAPAIDTADGWRAPPPARSVTVLLDDTPPAPGFTRFDPGAERPPPGRPIALATAPPPSSALSAFPGPQRRWSGSVWAMARGGSMAGLATAGQLAGPQAGIRLLYRPLPDVPVALAGRVSRPLREPGLEAALGVDWQPHPNLRAAVERRFRLEHGGRNAWAAFIAGGIYDRRIAGLRIDAYAQTGIVGARSRDLFADGAIRAGREIGPLTLGVGAWGAAQPRVERLDIGPTAVLRLPVAATTVSGAVDWRFRIAGHARPGNGPALTLGVDF